jgi:hypothetical protein
MLNSTVYGGKIIGDFMQKYDVYVCIISEQAAANLLPILDEKFRPNRAIFLISSEMAEQGKYLEKVFNSKGIDVIYEELSNVYDFKKCNIELLHIALKYKNANLVLNITGGLKLLSIAAYQAFSEIKKDIFYVDTRNRKISFLTKDENGEFIKDISLDSKGEIELYLSAYGIKTICNNYEVNNKNLNAMIDCFITSFDRYNEFLSKINSYASNVKDFKSQLTSEDQENEEFHFLLTRLKNVNKGKGIIGYSDGVVDFRNAKIRFFMNGGWLEDFIYKKLSEIKLVSSIHCGLKVDNDLENTNDEIFDNELDIVFMANNKLHIIECKAGKITVESGNKIIDKLNNLKRYGGTMTKACLVSYTYDMPYKVRKKAKSMNIEIIYGKALKDVEKSLEAWILRRD